jgi:hypothetical protein
MSHVNATVVLIQTWVSSLRTCEVVNNSFYLADLCLTLHVVSAEARRAVSFSGLRRPQLACREELPTPHPKLPASKLPLATSQLSTVPHDGRSHPSPPSSRFFKKWSFFYRRAMSTITKRRYRLLCDVVRFATDRVSTQRSQTVADTRTFSGIFKAYDSDFHRQYSVWLRAGRPGDRGSIHGRGKGFFL